MATTVGTAGAIQAPPATAGVFGQGVTYPPTVDIKGRLALSWGVDLVSQSLLSIAQTQRGERPMQPDYGAATIFEPIDADRLKINLEENIANHEPRARDVNVETKTGTGGDMPTTIGFSVTGDASQRSLTVPLFNGPARTGADK
jgi:uncharacterized protein